ncbi:MULTISPECIES: glycosyltransferase [Flammeovirga]|uniref:Glycosyltransferase n=1 Tax=Flammeovirga agarivorans TaxID=2726742 RepID=A0A7X8SGI4_9BACT|nr:MULTISPECIES: glycosyltransferase [Flammeovirga]NLR89722.1 glycosyltransferase [Flammeovirga agarivorans]
MLNLFSLFSITEWNIIYFLLALPQLVFWGIIAPIRLWKKENNVEFSSFPVSVIIAAKNEENNLPLLLDKLLQQEYSDFEIVIVNDRSTDCTENIIKQYQHHHKNIVAVNIKEIEDGISPKKNAITKGIEKAKHKHLLFIDADCIPVSNQWIQRLSSTLAHKELVLGVGMYKCDNHSWVQQFTLFETILTAIGYVSFSNIGVNYMGVGRNMGYCKDLFIRNNGFEKHKSVMSGDDDLFINQVANSHNTQAITYPDSITMSTPPKDWKSWFRQKNRHAGAGYHYNFSNKLILGTLSTSHIAVYFIYLLLVPQSMANLLFIPMLLIIRILLVTLCFCKFCSVTKTKYKWWQITIMDLMLIAYQIIIGVSSVISKRNTWI